MLKENMRVNESLWANVMVWVLTINFLLAVLKVTTAFYKNPSIASWIASLLVVSLMIGFSIFLGHLEFEVKKTLKKADK